MARKKAAEPERPKPEQDPETGRFLAGNSGNGGRQKGSRNKLSEAFVAVLFDNFTDAVAVGGLTKGAETIEKVRTEDPATYLRAIVALMPKQVQVKDERLDEVSNDDIDLLIAAVESARRLREAASGGEGASGQSQQASNLRPI